MSKRKTPLFDLEQYDNAPARAVSYDSRRTLPTRFDAYSDEQLIDWMADEVHEARLAPDDDERAQELLDVIGCALVLFDRVTNRYGQPYRTPDDAVEEWLIKQLSRNRPTRQILELAMRLGRIAERATTPERRERRVDAVIMARVQMSLSLRAT